MVDVPPGDGEQPAPPPPTGRRYGGLTPEERRAARRSRLVAAALERFSADGYANTTIESICSKAGVTARHFYEEFGSREELLRAVFDEAVEHAAERILHALEVATERSLGLEARVRSGVDAFVHAFLDDPRRARIMCLETIGVSRELEGHRRGAIHAFAAILESDAHSFVDVESTRREDVTLTTRALVGGINEIVVDWILADDPPPLDVVSRVTANMFLAVIAYRPGDGSRAAGPTA
ncbi:MAG: TetR/AcrR family transcriptional regulator [Actinomycetota bacterium]|jgi:AcrR family transcriptional regulator|nr:TetR/AcrR family transcriptional regulator [Actinomycetota bacterium]